MHSSMHCWHIAMQASSIAIMDAGVIPCMRSIERIMVLHMSAQFMHAGAHDIICVEHTVQACSHAEHASMHACMTDMSIVSMPGIDFMSLDIMSIIIESIPHLRPLPRDSGPADPPAAMLCRAVPSQKAKIGSPGCRHTEFTLALPDSLFDSQPGGSARAWPRSSPRSR